LFFWYESLFGAFLGGSFFKRITRRNSGHS
jgi:hypothetical protein